MHGTETYNMSSDSQALVKLEEVTKVFHAEQVETHALSEVSLEIHSGEYVSVAGPSGSGKSTLLSILGLLESPTRGRQHLKGTPVEALYADARARIRNREIGFIFQSFNLIGDLSVFDNVELPLTYRGMGKVERKRRVQESLERVGIDRKSTRLNSSHANISYAVF